MLLPALRPHAAWGYYGMIGCFARWDVAEGVCDAEIRARNDALAPLWSAGTALFPSIYSECSFAPGPDGVMRCQPGGPPMPDPYPGNANSTEEQRIAISLRETARVNREKLPVIPFTCASRDCCRGGGQGQGRVRDQRPTLPSGRGKE